MFQRVPAFPSSPAPLGSEPVPVANGGEGIVLGTDEYFLSPGTVISSVSPGAPGDLHKRQLFTVGA